MKTSELIFLFPAFPSCLLVVGSAADAGGHQVTAAVDRFAGVDRFWMSLDDFVSEFSQVCVCGGVYGVCVPLIVFVKVITQRLSLWSADNAARLVVTKRNKPSY